MINDFMQNIYYWANLCAALCCIIFAGFILFKRPSTLVRPSFIIAALVIIFYQVPLFFYSPVFDKENFDIWWFATSIHFAISGNLLWAWFTPRLNYPGIYQKPDSSTSSTFNNFELWFSIAVFFALLFIYLYRVPPTCTALYAIFFDPQLALLIREISVKLVGTNYSTYALSILSSTAAPITVFLAAHMVFKCFRTRKFVWIPLWIVMIIIAFMSTLISGAKGNLIPTFAVISVAGFFSAYIWYWRILLVVGLNIMLITILTLFGMQRSSMNEHEKNYYKFGECVVKLQACEPTKALLDSLKARDFSLDLTKSRISLLETEMEKSCAFNITNQEDNKIFSDNMTVKLTPKEKFIESEHAKAKFTDRIDAIINRAFAIPLIVARWHFLYVEEYGRPGFSGLSIARKFSDNYIDMPKKICEVYEFIRSGGDMTSTCTAPTSYLFTYPAYLGLSGLLIAMLATIAFDIIGSLVIRYASTPLNYITIGIIAVAGINFMTADFTTTILSHGAGFGLAIMLFFCLCRRLNRNKGN